jgi:hypothetical protein
MSSSIILGEDPSTYQVDYNPLDSVEGFHSLPRFSRSGDFSQLFSDNPEEVRDYSLGLMFLAVFIISAFTVWGVAILILKCIGPRHVGVLSGYPYSQEGCKTTAGRSTLSFSALTIIILAIVCVSKGLTELQGTTDTIDMTNQDAIKIHDEFQALTENLKLVSRKAAPVRDQLVGILGNDICPLTPGTSTEIAVRSIGNETLSDLVTLDNFIAAQIERIDFALEQVKNATTEVNDAVKKAQFTGPQVTAMMFPFFVIPAFLLVAVGMGWYDVFSEGYFTFMTWFIVPLFVLMTMFAFFAAGWTVLSVQANSDFCYPTPEQNVELILEQYGLTAGELYYDTAMFYAHQCSASVVSNPLEFMETFYDQLGEAESSLETFLQMVTDTTPEQLSQECGIEYSPVSELLNSMLAHTSILRNTSQRGLSLLQCSNIVPLYTNAVYNELCHDSIAGGKWCFACFLLAAFFGMIGVMFRGAMYPVDYFFMNENEKELYATSDSDGEGDSMADDSEIVSEDDELTEIPLNELDESAQEADAGADKYRATKGVQS